MCLFKNWTNLGSDQNNSVGVREYTGEGNCCTWKDNNLDRRYSLNRKKKDLIIQYVLQPSTDAFRHVCFVLVAYLLSHIKSYCVLVIQTCTFIHLLCSHIISLSCCCNTLISAWGMNKNVSYLILSILRMHWFSTWSFAGSKLICPKRSARNVSHKSWRVLKHYKEYTFV